MLQKLFYLIQQEKVIQQQNNTTMKHMENKQTAVEWLIDNIHLIPRFDLSDQEIIEKAKEMERSEIFTAYETGWVNGDLKKAPRFGSEYYDQKYNK